MILHSNWPAAPDGSPRLVVHRRISIRKPPGPDRPLRRRRHDWASKPFEVLERANGGAPDGARKWPAEDFDAIETAGVETVRESPPSSPIETSKVEDLRLIPRGM